MAKRNTSFMSHSRNDDARDLSHVLRLEHTLRTHAEVFPLAARQKRSVLYLQLERLESSA